MNTEATIHGIIPPLVTPLINDNELQLQRQQQSVTEVHLSHKRKCTVFMSFTFYMNHPKETSRVSY